MSKHKEVYLTCEENGSLGAERAADRHRPGGDLYRPGNRVHVEHGQVPQCGSEIPTSSTFGKSEPGYRIIVESDN